MQKKPGFLLLSLRKRFCTFIIKIQYIREICNGPLRTSANYQWRITWKTLRIRSVYWFSLICFFAPLNWVGSWNDVFHKNPLFIEPMTAGKPGGNKTISIIFRDFIWVRKTCKNFELVKVIALNDGKQAWVLDNWNGYCIRLTEVQHGTRTHIPASPGWVVYRSLFQ